jgi:hypothetical protein
MELQRLDISNLEKINAIDFYKMHNDSFIDVNEELPKPPTALSIGTINLGQEVFECAFGTYGNFSCITGASKAKKTFLKSLIIASYIGGSSINYAKEFKGHRDKDKFILDFDTEQSKWHSQRVFKRVPSITNREFIDGKSYDFYKPFYLRKYTYKERLQFIEWCILENKEYRDNIGFVNIDGFADLVADVNDLPSCNELVAKLLKWTDISQCHLTGILHKNFGSAKPTGHLGSAILKKAETVCMLDVNENDKSYTNVSFPYTRGFPINDFSFRINEFGLPIVEEIEQNNVPF